MAPVHYEDHPHVVKQGDMIRCTVCHRQWQSDDVPPPCQVIPDAGQPFHDRPRTTSESKKQGWRGPGDHGKTKVRTSARFRR